VFSQAARLRKRRGYGLGYRAIYAGSDPDRATSPEGRIAPLIRGPCSRILEEEGMASDQLILWDACSHEGCIGVRVGRFAWCLAHLAEQEPSTFDEVVRGIGAEGAIDARGVRLSVELLMRVLDVVPRKDGRPSFRMARFDHAIIPDAAGFGRAIFEGEVGFGWATFLGSAGFGGATFQCSAWFNGVTFQQGAWFTGVLQFCLDC
jgi:Pentapeptide repeats (9 copies)